MKRLITTALLVLTIGHVSILAFPQEVVESGPWKLFRQEHPSLSYEEISTPFVVREISGRILYCEGKPLEGASFQIGLNDGTTLGTDTDSKGSFELRAFRLFGPFVRSAPIRPGTYRFKVTKDGFHSAVGTIVVSRKAPKQSAIAIKLKPGEGYQEEQPKPVPDEQLLPLSAAIPVVETHKHKKYPEKYAVIYAPVSLAAGRVRTAEFPVEKQWYDIMIEVEKPLPFHDMQCMLGDSLVRPEECGSTRSLLRAEWTVWDSGHIIQWGSTRENTACIYANKNIFACVGGFSGEAGKKYVVQVHFTEDGTPLNVANPRLIVIRHKDMW